MGQIFCYQVQHVGHFLKNGFLLSWNTPKYLKLYIFRIFWHRNHLLYLNFFFQFFFEKVWAEFLQTTRGSEGKYIIPFITKVWTSYLRMNTKTELTNPSKNETLNMACTRAKYVQANVRQIGINYQCSPYNVQPLYRSLLPKNLILLLKCTGCVQVS